MKTDSPWHDPRDRLRPLREFVVGMTVLCEQSCDEAFLLQAARPLLSGLLADDRWLFPVHSSTEPGQYRQYLLNCDPLERFCVVSFA